MGTRPPWSTRKNLRLGGFDYRADGPYFVTVCTKGRRPLLGSIRDGLMIPDPAGEVVLREWFALPERFPCVILDEFTLMPNHFHGVLAFATDDFSNPTLGRVMGALKSVSALQMGPLLGIRPGLIWQRGYHDHIIPNNRGLDAIREYIRENPKNWEKDSLRGEG